MADVPVLYPQNMAYLLLDAGQLVGQFYTPKYGLSMAGCQSASMQVLSTAGRLITAGMLVLYPQNGLSMAGSQSASMPVLSTTGVPVLLNSLLQEYLSDFWESYLSYLLTVS